MRTEKQKTCWRCFVYILFWTIIFCLAFFLIPRGGTGDGGSGSGSGTHGSGPGRGLGNSGTGLGKGGSGSQPQGTAQALADKAPPAAHTGNSPQVKTPKKIEPKKSEGQLAIRDKSSASDDTATIFLPSENAGSGSSSGTKAGFFGVKVDGPVIFLLDTSSSMNSSTKDGSMSRLKLVKQEITQVLQVKFDEAKRKRSREHFRIVCFNSTCSFMPDMNSYGYKFSDMQNVAAAIDFVKNLAPGGGTAMYSAWQSIIPIIGREEIQAVYFLSDGEPNDRSGADILNLLKTSVPTLKIHTVSMGKKSQLLKTIASQHKGIYREVY